MSKLDEYIGKQLGNPHGIIGEICCFLMNVVNRSMYNNLVSLLDFSRDDNVLDIGYGNGYLLQCIYKKCKSNLYGIDISKDMKEVALKKNKDAMMDGKLFLDVGDCCDLTYQDGFFDGITSINTMYFWNDPIVGLSEIYRVLKKGSSFYNVVYSKEFLDKVFYTKKGFKKYDLDQLVQFGKEVGFDHVSVQTILKGNSFVIIYRK